MPGSGGRIDSPNINQAAVVAPPAPVKKATKKAATTAAATPTADPAQQSGDAAEG